MPSIIIEKEDFEFNCLYKTIWDSYPGIGYIGGEIIFIKIKLTQLFPYLFFLLNIQKQHTDSIIYMLSLRMCRNGEYFQ
jgi:hypothetical protein